MIFPYSMIEESGKPLAWHSRFNWGDPSFAQLNRFISMHALSFVHYSPQSASPPQQVYAQAGPPRVRTNVLVSKELVAELEHSDLDAARLNQPTTSKGLKFSETKINMVCPWHGFEFDIRTGCHHGNPRYRLKPVKVRVEGADVIVTLPDEKKKQNVT
jgi:hypothetical protein